MCLRKQNNKYIRCTEESNDDVYLRNVEILKLILCKLHILMVDGRQIFLGSDPVVAVVFSPYSLSGEIVF